MKALMIGRCGSGIYFASKKRHAPLWRALRASGIPTVSTWIDELGAEHPVDYKELSVRCLAEIADATALLVYCEPGELLKGALVEAGAALMSGKPVLCVGSCDSLNAVFCKHPQWYAFPTIDEALAAFLAAQPEGIP